MARRYDQRTTTFSPEGRLYQVEYAMEAINHAGTCLGILTENGILVAAEKRTVNELLDNQVLKNEKIYRINENMICTVAGITADANVLINKLRFFSVKFKHEYSHPIPCEQLVQYLANQKQSFTQRGGKRPFGVSLLYAGWDKHYGYQLYQSDPSGNYSSWKATAIGFNHQKATTLFKEEYKPDLSIQDAKKLIIKALAKCMETKLQSDKVEMAFLAHINGSASFEETDVDEITLLIEDYKQRMKEEAEAEAAKKARKKDT